MKILSLLTVLFFSAFVQAETETPIIVAVVDSGLKSIDPKLPLCKTGHKDFTGQGTILDKGSLSHGSNVAGLITKHAGLGNFCLVIVKVFKQVDEDYVMEPAQYFAALKYVAELRPALVNLSLSGIGPLKDETRLLKEILNAGIVVVAAAGNNDFNLDVKGCIVYPACADSRIFVIGNKVGTVSNTGSVVDYIVDGQNATAGGVTLSGTSQSAAIFSGQAVAGALKLEKKQKNGVVRK